jgi:hypothetical protein
VTVANGLFTVGLGSGTVSDGAGPGTYTSLAQVFRDYSSLWLETKVGSETLAPRTRVVSTAYALNADSLGGLQASSYVDTTASSQTKAGALTCSNGIEGDSNAGFGVFGNGGAAGGAFQATTGTAYAYLGYHNPEQYGIKAAGSDAGGFFRGGASGTAYVAQGDYGLNASGNTGGGYFAATGASGQAYAAFGDVGMYGYGNAAGGKFQNNATGATAGAASGDYGLDADGSYCAPFCGAGGRFTNFPNSGTLYAALGDTGVYSTGASEGGEFACDNKTGHAQLALGDFGVVGYGADPGGLSGGGGHFKDVTSGSETWVAADREGVYSIGASIGGHFENAGGQSSVDLATGSIGVYAVGSSMGGSFNHSLSSSFAHLATNSGNTNYTIIGNGAKSFVQNDPFDKDKVVVFAALEGDEAGTYTRGTARLENGRATVPLSPSFALVTNPDIGLTAHVTPRGAAVPLTVSSVGSDLLAVEGPEGSDAIFDYVVFGLRLGFEEHAPIQPKTQEAFIPRLRKPHPATGTAVAPAAAPAAALEAAAGIDPAFTPLGRFTAMRAATGDTTPLDLSRAEALIAAAGTGDAPAPPPVRGVTPVGPRGSPRPAPAPVQGRATISPGGAGAAPGPAGASVPPAPPAPAPAPPAPAPSTSGLAPAAGEAPIHPDGTTLAAVAETVGTGDILALDPAVSPERLTRSRGGAGETVVGIVAGEPGARWSDVAPLALSGTLVRCQVDAAWGAVRPGDLIVASPSPGIGRRADNPAPGSAVGRALEGLDTGIGSILLLARPQ